MENNIGSSLKSATTLIHVRKKLIKLFKSTKNQTGRGIIRIGYVAGILTSDGLKYFERNRKIIAKYTDQLRKVHKFPMFSTVDVFSDEVYSRLEEYKLSFEEREAKLRNFWREIFKSGYVTDIFMTPRWNKSKGATDEHKTAKESGLRIHYIEDTHLI